LSDDSFSLKPKHVASNKIFINLIAFHILYFSLTLRLSQRDVVVKVTIDKDIVDKDNIDEDISFICRVSPAIMHPSTLRNISRGTVL